jgi:glycosyltransferase involved in cell wall biosynthesis
MQSLTIAHIESLNLEQWRVAHERGTVPGVTPYGLHRLQDFGLDVHLESVYSTGRDPRKWISAMVATLSQSSRSGLVNPARHAAIAWDERGVAGLYTRYPRSHHFLGAGVIWATDQFQRRTNLVRLMVLRRVLREFDFIWCLSRAQLPVLETWLGVQPSKLHFVPFGIDTDFFPARPWPDRPMLLSLGNDRDRDIPTLFRAFEQILARRPGIDIVVQTRSNLPPPDGVRIYHYLDAGLLRFLYSKATLLVIATRPNLHLSGMTTILEAMATGRPVVISRTPGIEDYVRDEVTGRLAVPSDPDSFADVILELLSDTGHLSSMGEAAAAYTRKYHSEATMCRSLASVVRSTT